MEQKDQQTAQDEQQTVLARPLRDYPIQLAAAWEVFSDVLASLQVACSQSRWQGEKTSGAIRRHSLEVQRLEVSEAYARSQVQRLITVNAGDEAGFDFVAAYDQHWREQWGAQLAEVVADEWRKAYDVCLAAHRKRRVDVAERARAMDACRIPRIVGESLPPDEPKPAEPGAQTEPAPPLGRP